MISRNKTLNRENASRGFVYNNGVEFECEWNPIFSLIVITSGVAGLIMSKKQ